MAGMVGMTAHGLEGPSSPTNSTPFGICAAFCSLILATLWWRVAYYLSGRPRSHGIYYGLIETIVLGLWLLYTYVVPLEHRASFCYFIWAFNLVMVFLPPTCMSCIWPQLAQDYPAPVHKRFWCMEKKPTFVNPITPTLVPLRLEHFTERMGVMSIIFLGESVWSV